MAFSFNWCQSLEKPKSVISGVCPSKLLLECVRGGGHIVRVDVSHLLPARGRSAKLMTAQGSLEIKHQSLGEWGRYLPQVSISWAPSILIPQHWTAPQEAGYVLGRNEALEAESQPGLLDTSRVRLGTLLPCLRSCLLHRKIGTIAVRPSQIQVRECVHTGVPGLAIILITEP